MVGRHTRETRSRGRGLRLQVELLEDRCCPSTVAVEGTALVVHGDRGDNAVQITDDGLGNVTATVDGETTSGTGISQVVVHGDRGDDTIDYQLTGKLTGAMHLVFNLGEGNDVLGLDCAAGVFASRLKIDIGGFKGDDAVTATFGELADVNLFFRANLHAGNDALDISMLGPLTGTARARFFVHTLKGDDTVAFHAAGVDVAAEALLALKLQTGVGDDNVTVDYSGQVSGGLNVRADGGTGLDTVAVNLDTGAASTGTLQALVKGGPRDDQLTLNVGDLVGGGDAGALTIIRALVDGGPGSDLCTHTDNVTAVRCES